MRRKPRAKNRAEGATDRDKGEETFALLTGEAVSQQRPEHHRDEQVEHTEPNKKYLSTALTHGGGREHQQCPKGHQTQHEECVGRSDEL